MDFLAPLATQGILGILLIIALLVIKYLYQEVREIRDARLEDWKTNFSTSSGVIKDLLTASQANSETLKIILQNSTQSKK